MKAWEKIKKYYPALIVGFFILAYLFFNYSYYLSDNKARKFTDDFFKLIQNENIEELFSIYAIESDLSFEELKSEFDHLFQNYGSIKRYEYRGSTKGGEGLLTNNYKGVFSNDQVFSAFVRIKETNDAFQIYTFRIVDEKRTKRMPCYLEF